MRSPRGFTLLELLIAMTILVIAMTIIFSTFSATLSAWEKGNEMLDDLHHGDFVMEQLVAALRSAAFFPTRPDKYGFRLKSRQRGNYPGDQISWVASGTAFIPNDSIFANGMYRITVSIDENDEGEPGVLVQAWPHLPRYRSGN